MVDSNIEYKNFKILRMWIQKKKLRKIEINVDVQS